jgi:hypothetical protein
MDYAHAMTRLPELHISLSDAAIPDPTEEQEFESLTRSIPKLISILPDVLSSQSDPRHKVALAEMVSGLTAILDQVKPLALVRSGSTHSSHFLKLTSPFFDSGTITDTVDGSGRSYETATYPNHSARTVHEVYPGFVTGVVMVLLLLLFNNATVSQHRFRSRVRSPQLHVDRNMYTPCVACSMNDCSDCESGDQ